jgi:predicted permease
VLNSIWQDVTYAQRLMRRSPVITLAAVASLALGIGANTAVFSITDSLVLRTLPVRQPDRLALVSGGDWPAWSYPIWEEIRDRPYLFEGSFAWDYDRMNIAAGGQAEFVEGIFASGRFFDVLGVPTVVGQPLTEANDRRVGGPDCRVAVISYGFWQRQFGGAADVVGRSLMIERVAFTIVGVTPPKFFGPDVGRAFDVIVPLSAEPLIRGRESGVENPRRTSLGIMVRLKTGQTIDGATAALRGVQPLIREATLPTSWNAQQQSRYMRQPWTLLPAASGRSSMRTRFQQPLTVLTVVVALVLLIACANVANLLLARATGRTHELRMRRSLGASRTRLARQFLVESMMLASMGAAVGLILAMWSSPLLVGQLSTMTSAVFLDLQLNWRVLGFCAGIAMGTTMLFGTAPAFFAARVRASDILKEVGSGLAGARRAGPGSAIVIAQVALSLVLVFAGLLFVRTFSTLATLDLGFDQDRLLVVDIDAENSSMPPAEHLDVVARIRRAAASVPGVAHAAVGLKTPTSAGGVWMLGVELAEGPAAGEEEYIYANFVTTDWFAAYGTRMLAGRAFTERDGVSDPIVAIVNEDFARRFLGGGSPLGLGIRTQTFRSPIEIVGVVEDVVYRSLREPATPMVYLPLAEMSKPGFHHDPPPPISVGVRAESGSPAMLIRAVASAIEQVDPSFTMTLRPLTDHVDARLVQERILSILSSFFAVLAVLLAGVGLFGMTSYTVARRRAEIALRMAIGAGPEHVVRMVLRRVATLVGVGIIIGAVMSFWAARFAEALLFGLEPRDPVTFVAAACVLAAVGALAGWIPARRATCADPMELLKGEDGRRVL